MNGDPVRMLDDSSLPDLLREDLAEAANQPLPPVDLALGLASLNLAIKAGGAAALPSASASATVKAAALAHGSWWGGALIGFGAGLVGAAAIWLAPPLSHPAAPPAPAPIEAAAVVPAPIPLGAGATVASAVGRSPSPTPRAPSANMAPSPSIVPLASAATEPVDGPAEELALLVRIKQQATSDPAAAVALVDEGHRRFPRGSFYQERESIAILALAQLGRTGEARPRAQRFLDAHPASPYAERLRTLVAPP